MVEKYKSLYEKWTKKIKDNTRGGAIHSEPTFNERDLERIKKELQEEAYKEQEPSEMNHPLPIEENYTREKINTPQIYKIYELASRKGLGFINKRVNSWYPKFFNENNLIAIALLLLIIGIVVIGLPYFISHRPTQTSPGPDNNIAENVANPAPVLTNTSNITNASNITETVTQSKFKSTYIDNEGNMREVMDYTSQGGGKYDIIINSNTTSVQSLKPTISTGSGLIAVNKYYPTINGANTNEREYILNILNNTKPDIVNKIKSINVKSIGKFDCNSEKYPLGCASSDGTINIVNLMYYKNQQLTGEYEAGQAYRICGTFAGTLNHEIGHIKGFSIGDSSEKYAENYAYDHTTVNTVYEPEKRC